MSQSYGKLTDHLYVAPRSTEGENLAPQGALHMLPSELGGPMKDMYRAREAGGRQTNDISQATTTILRMGAKRGIRPTRKRHGSFRNRSRPAPSIIRAGQ